MKLRNATFAAHSASVTIGQHIVDETHNDGPTGEDVLDFWFAGVCDDATRAQARVPVWFDSDARFDAAVATQLGDVAAAALSGALDHWAECATGRLALIVLLDQVPRHIHRGFAQAFAGDARALALADQGVALGHDRELRLVERVFFYLPFEHAENLDAQDRYITFCHQHIAAAGTGFDRFARDCLAAGETHREVIRRFGRFPHRNAALGRTPSSEEIAWYAEHQLDWGQRKPATS